MESKVSKKPNEELALIARSTFLALQNLRRRLILGSYQNMSEPEKVRQGMLAIVVLTRTYVGQLIANAADSERAHDMGLLISGTLNKIQAKLSSRETFNIEMQVIREEIKRVTSTVDQVTKKEILKNYELDRSIVELGWEALAEPECARSDQKTLQDFFSQVIGS